MLHFLVERPKLLLGIIIAFILYIFAANFYHRPEPAGSCVPEGVGATVSETHVRELDGIEMAFIRLTRNPNVFMQRYIYDGGLCEQEVSLEDHNKYSKGSRVVGK